MAWREYREKQRQEEKEHGQQQQKHAEQLLESVNTAAATVRNIYITFLLLGTYIGLIIASTTHEQLLRVSSVKLPILDVDLPILGFYQFVPWLFVLFHFNLLLQFYLLTDKWREFQRSAADLHDTESGPLHTRLLSFPLVQRLSDRQHGGFIQLLLSLMIWITVVLAPLGLLLSAQIRFLPYHDPEITWGHRGALSVDIVLLLAFWPRIVAGRSAWAWWRKPEQWWPDAGMLAVATLVVSGASFVATVPGEDWEPSFVDTLFIRHLFLPAGTMLTLNELSDETLEKLEQGDEKQRKEALKQVRGLNLEGRDLRHAYFVMAILPEADLEVAQLQGANLPGARLQGANLVGAQLQGANLRRAHLQGANLPGARLQGANLREAVVYATDFDEADFSSADLRGLISAPVIDEWFDAKCLDLGTQYWPATTSDFLEIAFPTSIDPPLLPSRPMYDHCGLFADWPSPPDDTVFRTKLSALRADLACNDAFVAEAMVSRVVSYEEEMENFLAHAALLAAADSGECPELAAAVEPKRDELVRRARSTE